MGEVIDFPIRPFKLRDLGPASPQVLEDMYWLVNALRIGEVEIIPGAVPVLCGDCIARGATECRSPQCGLYGDGA